MLLVNAKDRVEPGLNFLQPCVILMILFKNFYNREFCLFLSLVSTHKRFLYISSSLDISPGWAWRLIPCETGLMFAWVFSLLKRHQCFVAIKVILKLRGEWGLRLFPAIPTLLFEISKCSFAGGLILLLHCEVFGRVVVRWSWLSFRNDFFIRHAILVCVWTIIIACQRGRHTIAAISKALTFGMLNFTESSVVTPLLRILELP